MGTIDFALSMHNIDLKPVKIDETFQSVGLIKTNLSMFILCYIMSGRWRGICGAKC